MEAQKADEKYLVALGKVISNLLSLEIILRRFLQDMDLQRYGSPPPAVDRDKIKVGDVVLENYFTNYDSLGKLVEKYNELVTSLQARELCVDDTVVKLRDAFAHGRVLSLQPGPPFQLYKFGKPSKSHRVPVEYVTDLTESQLSGYIHRLFKQIENVLESCKRFCPSAVGLVRWGFIVS